MTTHRHPPRRYVPRGAEWTAAEDEAFRKMWAEGIPTDIMAKRLGRSKNSVCSHRKTLDLTPRTHRERANDDPVRWTPEMIAELRRLAAHGRSATEIAATMGLSRGSVCPAASRNKIKFLNGKRPGRPPKTAGKNNNPSGWSGTRPKLPGPSGVPVMPPCTPTKSIADLGRHHCRYIGDRPEILTIDTPIYCGQRTVEGQSWCPEHSAVVFNPGARRTRAPQWLVR